MPATKNQVDRYYIIDDIFHRWNDKWYTQKELLSLINKELRERGLLEVSKRTLQNDIEDMQNGACKAPIEKGYINRERVYRYFDSHFSLKVESLSESDKTLILQSLDVLSLFEGNPCVKWMEEIRKMLTHDSSNHKRRKVVLFEENYNSKIRKILYDLLNFMASKTPITLNYQSSHSTEILTFELSPLYLKQENQKWYLFAKSVKSVKIYKIHISNILSVTQCFNIKYEDVKTDKEDFFYDIVNLKQWPINEVKHLIFWSKDVVSKYIQKNPLHPTQREVEASEFDKLSIENTDLTSGKYFMIDVAENEDLYALLFSYGPEIKIVAPITIYSEFCKRLEAMSAYYH